MIVAVSIANSKQWSESDPDYDICQQQIISCVKTVAKNYVRIILYNYISYNVIVVNFISQRLEHYSDKKFKRV